MNSGSTESLPLRVARCLDGTGRPARRVFVAYSGGVDSSALLHAMAQYDARGETEMCAVHVNHGLHAAAGEWERFCRRQAQCLGVPFQSLHVTVTHERRSLEEAARAARYAALVTLLHGGDVLMTAHHEDDQAETVLLQLLRGAGPEGLAAMPRCARFGAGHLLRPWLDVARADIEAYARAHHLQWLNDPANDDPRYDRAYLRRQLAPLLSARWPAWRETVSRAARHQAEACELIEWFARRKYPHCRNDDGTLSVACCSELREVERKAVLRYWLRQSGLPTPSEKQLRQLLEVLLSGNARAGALVRWPGAEVRHYRGCLYAMTPLAPPPARDARHWPGGTDLELPELNATLTWRQLVARAPELVGTPSLTVRLRSGGERCAFKGGHKRLKKIFQERGVPPWERARVPLIYAGDELRVVWTV